MEFVLRLFLTFLFAPLLGCIIANIPSFILISLFAENGGGGLGTYPILLIGSLMYGYTSMVLAIFIVASYSRHKFGWRRYAIMGGFIGLATGLMAAFPFFLMEDESPKLILSFLATGILNGACIGLVSYLLMGRTDLVLDKVDPIP